MPVKPQDDQNDEPANRIIASMFATIRTPRSRPVIAAVRMRRSKAVDSRGAPKFAAGPGHRGRGRLQSCTRTRRASWHPGTTLPELPLVRK
ncbi:hypothetical protein [Nonomuraea sp. NEAU-A123]|uniref:hypothetical protein n=1 Tax=Nonomuraea sp. NEAU-A123 TaxID=2839649 RepID=UPI001BE41858|nr:hypothetical protein [Nonomuraea sp. NEAU-A123]MBT2229017.1 hypothetical protein [Nonomuraea sp. NEAU-A123]